MLYIKNINKGWSNLFLLALLLTCIRESGSVPVSVLPSWVNACRLGEMVDIGPSDEELPRLSDEQIFKNIVLQSKIAREHCEDLIQTFIIEILLSEYDDFEKLNSIHYLSVREAFNDSGFIDSSEHFKYDWLPSIPSQDEGDGDHIANLELEETLKRVYEYVQRFGVGLEQSLVDQVRHGGNFVEDFINAEGKLRQVLCEMHQGLLHFGVEQNADVTREIMQQRYREMSSKIARDFRDYIVLRDYKKTLEYIVSVFEHFEGRFRQTN